MTYSRKIFGTYSALIIFSITIGFNQSITAQIVHQFPALEDQFAITDSDSNTTLVGQWIPNGPIDLNFEDIALYDDYAYILGYNDGLHIIDISILSNPEYVKTIPLLNHSFSIKINEDYAYIINEGLRIFDLSNPNSPEEVGHWSGNGIHLDIQEDLAFISCGTNFYIIDIGDKTDPKLLGEYYSGSSAHYLEEFDVEGDYAFISADYYHIAVTWKFETINISDPANIQKIGEYSDHWGYSSWTPNGNYSYKDIFIKDMYLYAAHSYAGFGIFNISDPANPLEVGFYRGKMYALDIEGNYAYVLDHSDHQFQILNISDPAAPFLQAYYELDGYSISIKDGIAYIVGEDLKIIKNNLVTDLKSDRDPVPKNFNLKQNYPNPFNPSTTIIYCIPVNSGMYSAGSSKSTDNRMQNSENRIENQSFSNSIIQSRNGGLLPVKLVVYDILGKEVANLVNEQQRPGNYEVKWDASALTSGVYFYTITAGKFTDTKKMLLIR